MKAHNRIEGPREPNGRLIRKDKHARRRHAFQKAEIDMINVGVSARTRVLGVSENQARDPMAGSYAGRLCLCGELSQLQYDAATTYYEHVMRYRRALDAPRELGAVDLNRVQGRATSVNVDDNRAVISRYDDARRAVQEKQNELRGTANLFGALSVLLIEDREVGHLVGDLRVALNALAKHYRLRR